VNRLWAIRGSKVVPDRYLITGCVLMVALPNLFLWFKVKIAVRQQVKKELVVGSAEDHRDHLLVYLFAMLLPARSETLPDRTRQGLARVVPRSDPKQDQVVALGKVDVPEHAVVNFRQANFFSTMQHHLWRENLYQTVLHRPIETTLFRGGMRTTLVVPDV